MFLLEVINHVFRTELLEKHWLPKLTRSIIETTSDLDIIEMLTDDVTVAAWNNEGLPSDRMSVENATILTNCERWPLMIDPQLQGVKWIKQKYGDELVVVRLGQKNYLDTIERAVGNGDVVLLENIEESTDPVLDPLLGRNTIKKGKAIRLGDKEIDFAPTFRLILHTKLANPHYRPEMQVRNVFTEKNNVRQPGVEPGSTAWKAIMLTATPLTPDNYNICFICFKQAQTTLINFTVTRSGLEDQLLADVVRKERRDLEEAKSALTKQQNEFKIRLKQLEDDLLARLSTAQGNFLGVLSI